MPDRNQHLNTVPDTNGITLNVVQCEGCGLMQLDNEPVWYWQESINSTRVSASEVRPVDSVSFMKLEHQPSPNVYLKSIGSGSIQVPNCDKITAYDFCIDHLMYFTAPTLRFALENSGLFVISMESIFNDVILSAQVKRYERVAIYGAGHQAFAWLALHPNFEVDYIFDDNSKKQYRYSPATNIQIVAPVYVDAIIVMAGGYSDEVLKKLDDFKGGVAVLRGSHIEVIR